MHCEVCECDRCKAEREWYPQSTILRTGIKFLDCDLMIEIPGAMDRFRVSSIVREFKKYMNVHMIDPRTDIGL